MTTDRCIICGQPVIDHPALSLRYTLTAWLKHTLLARLR